MANVPRTRDFRAFFRKDPNCGLHVVPYSREDKPICIIIISADETLGLIEFCQKQLRQRNTDRTVSDIPNNRRRHPAPDDQPLGPEVPYAEWFNSTFCNDPTCGLHITAYDSDDTPICEIVMSVEQTWTIIERGKGHLYDKATQRAEAIPIDEAATAGLPGKATLEKLRVNADGRPIWTVQVVDTRNMEDLYHRAFHESGLFAVATTMVIRWMSNFNARPEQNPKCMVCQMHFGRREELNASRELPVAVYAAVSPGETTAHLHGVCEKCFAQVVGDALDYLEPYYRALWPD